MDQGALESYYSDVNALLDGAGIAFTPEGSAALTLTPEGTFAWTPDVQVNAEVAGTTIVISVGGTANGTYTATGDRITATSPVSDGLVVSASIDGAETDPGEVAQQVEAALPRGGGNGQDEGGGEAEDQGAHHHDATLA